MLITIFNIIVGVIVFSLVISMMQTYQKYESYFGDDDKRMPLQYKFLRLLVIALVLALVAAAVNIGTFL